MKWLVVGDLHGELRAFNHHLKMIEGKIAYDAIIQLGDFGFWKDTLQKCQKRTLPELCRRPIYFVRGNHEEYHRDKRGKQRGPFFSDYEGVIVPKYFHKCERPPKYINDDMIRIGNLDVLGVGGAVSTDKQRREPGLSWWPEEEVNEDNVQRIIEENLKPDVILSHDVPVQFHERSKYKGRFLHRHGDRMLGLLYEHIQPKCWMFGHYHKYMQWEDNETGTRFICLPSWGHGFGIFDTETMKFRIWDWKSAWKN